MIGALKPVPDGDVARREIDEAAGDEKGADAPWSLVPQEERGLGNATEAADARPHQNAGTLLPFRSIRFPVGIAQSHLRRAHRIDDEVVNLALLLHLHPIVGVELALAQRAARHEARDLAGKIVDNELLDPACPTGALEQARPSGLHAAAKRRDETQTCNYDATQHSW